MKKTKYLALVLVVAIMMMGAGYALWTDTLVVNSTVKTGILDVDFIEIAEPVNDPTLVTVYSGIETLSTHADDNGWDRDKVVVRIGNLYPGAKVTRTITLKNVGTIPVKVDSLNFQTLLLSDTEGQRVEPILQHMNVAIKVEGQTFTLPKSVSPLIVAEAGDFEIAVNKEITFEIEFQLDENAPNELTEGKTVQYDITTNFKQFNK